MSIRLTVDWSVNAAYIELSSDEVASTKELESGINVDLDELDVVVGIEVLELDADLPWQRLRDEFHVPSRVVDLLYKLRPTIANHVTRFEQAPEGVSSHTGNPVKI